MENLKRLLHEGSATRQTAGVGFHLGLVFLFVVLWYVCLCIFACAWTLCGQSHLFENHELIQEVNTLASEEFPDSLLSLEALRVRGGVHLGRLVPQEL